MTPTIIRAGKLRVMVYPKDHYPPHVHVIAPGAEAKFDLEDLSVFFSAGFSQTDLKRLKKFLKEHKQLLTEAWYDYER